jgi:hypothetical protein
MRGRYLVVESYQGSAQILSGHWVRAMARRRVARHYRLRNASVPPSRRGGLAYRIYTRAQIDALRSVQS